jgi:hypothetical protein
MNPDFLDLLRAFAGADVRFLIVGAYALAAHGRPRATGDLDVWVDATPENAARVVKGLQTFRVRMPVSDVDADFIGVADLITNKRALGRTKDLADIEGLES